MQSHQRYGDFYFNMTYTVLIWAASYDANLDMFVFLRRLESMRDGLIELQLAVPALQMDTSATATLKNNNGLVLQLETAFNMPETTSVQKAILRYGNEAHIANEANIPEMNFSLSFSLFSRWLCR